MEVSFLLSSKYSIAEKKIMFIGSITKIIYDRNIFKNNDDLKRYIKIFQDYFEKTNYKFTGYKEYLFKSRTLLASRISRMVFEDKSSVGTRFLIEQHVNFLNENNIEIIKKNSKTTNKKNSTSLLGDFINRDK